MDFHPFIVRVYWGGGGQVSYHNGVVRCDNSTLSTSFIVEDNSLSYDSLLQRIYSFVQLDRDLFNLKLVMFYTFQGIESSTMLTGEEGIRMMYFLAANVPSFVAEINVTWENRVTSQPFGLFDLNVEYSEPQFNSVESGLLNLSNVVNPTTEDNGVLLNSENEISDTEDSEVAPSVDGTDDEGDFVVPLSGPTNSDIFQGFALGPVSDYDECQELRASALPDFDDEDGMDIWNPQSNTIRQGMFFKSKEEVMSAVRGWNVACNRELLVKETRPNCWRAICYTRSKKFEQQVSNTQECHWYASAVLKKYHHMWQLTKWVDRHTCYGTVVSNNNRCVSSKDVAFYIANQISTNIAYEIKHIRTDIKNVLNVDISYAKGWFGRRKAIENVHGTWVSNFNELPNYIRALQESNPGTVVQWLHQPYSSSSMATFKYVFWAFKPSIDAFKLSPPFISVDATHLKGDYKGKLLIAISKNANNYILPVAYALVDEETVESWCWFFNVFRQHVLGDSSRRLCVISDRHRGIMHAMENLDGWKEPHAFHRYCLRHVRSNMMSKYKKKSLKSLCWTIGCTTQERKYRWAIRQMKRINPEAWDYLKEIPRNKWTLLRDHNNRRWGNLTTNMSECFNNVLRFARLMPIKACIDYTFQKDVFEYAKHAEMALKCNTALSPRMWKLFNERDLVGQEHTVTLFDHSDQRYRVTSRLQTNSAGGNDYTVEYRLKTCTCGKWQVERFPCSHAIAVCRQRNGQPHDIVNKRYYTTTYRQQYSGHYHPLPHKDYWKEAGWRIQADTSKITTHRGRRRARRIRNEMDVTYPDEPRNYKCGLCKENGHKKNTCPYRNQ